MSDRPTRLPGALAETPCAPAASQQFVAGEIAYLPVQFIQTVRGDAEVAVVLNGRLKKVRVSAGVLRREVGL